MRKEIPPGQKFWGGMREIRSWQSPCISDFLNFDLLPKELATVLLRNPTHRVSVTDKIESISP